jgi:hypothetical protein
LGVVLLLQPGGLVGVGDVRQLGGHVVVGGLVGTGGLLVGV